MKNNLIFTILSLQFFFIICSFTLQGEDANQMIISQITEEVVLERGSVADTIRSFRTFEDIIKASHTNPEISIIGVEDRYISGSGQFTGTNIELLSGNIQEVAQTIDGIIVLDLRLESHVFINDVPYTWKSSLGGNQLNRGMGVDAVEKDETDRLNLLFEEGIATVSNKGGLQEQIAITTAFVERSVVEAMGFTYVRLPVLDFSHPADEEVDAFISIMKNYPNHWLHIHCQAGKGRTTTLLALYDMFHNAKQVSFDEILFRQKAIGGQDFLKHQTIPYSGAGEYKQELAIKRHEFLKLFYQYSQEVDLGERSWSDWLHSNQTQVQ